jgi:hypothetical protein
MTLTAVERAARNDRALEMHLAGLPYSAIVSALGYSSKSRAHAGVQAALIARRGEGSASADARPSGGLSEDQQLEVARLDALLGALWARARRGEVAAVDRVLKLAERRTTVILAAAGGMPAPPPADDPLDEIKARRDAKRGLATTEGSS